MSIRLLQPPAEHYWTGGYLYNQQLARFSQMKLESLSLNEHSAKLAVAAGENSRGDLMILDSLYLYDSGFAAIWPRLQPAFFLIHHLQSCDHSLSEIERQAFAEVEKQFLQDAQGLIVTSEHMALLLQKIFPEMPIICCSPGVDTELVMRSRLLRQKFLASKPAGPIRLLSVGHITQRKGFMEGAELLSELLNQHPSLDWQWLIAGSDQSDPAYAQKFRQTLQQRSLQTRVDWLGLQAPQQILPLMSQADILFFPSLFETYGMVVLEALSVGLPVIANKQGEIPRILQQPASGILYTMQDLAGALERIGTLLEKRSALTIMSRDLLRQYPLRSWQFVAQAFETSIKAVQQAQHRSWQAE